jgi:hypothetical protein
LAEQKLKGVEVCARALNRKVFKDLWNPQNAKHDCRKLCFRNKGRNQNEQVDPKHKDEQLCGSVDRVGLVSALDRETHKLVEVESIENQHQKRHVCEELCCLWQQCVNCHEKSD